MIADGTDTAEERRKADIDHFANQLPRPRRAAPRLPDA